MKSITDFVTSVLEGFANREYTTTIFYDLSKPFACVPHDHLINKREGYSFDMNSLNLVLCHLSNRFQQTTVVKVSVLGHLLFLIYVNDLPGKLND